MMQVGPLYDRLSDDDAQQNNRLHEQQSAFDFNPQLQQWRARHMKSQGRLVADLRAAIWVKPMELAAPAPPADLNSAVDSMDSVEQSAHEESGRLRLLPKKLVGMPFSYGIFMDRSIDPYGGPHKIDLEYHK